MDDYKYKPTTAFWKIQKLIKEGLTKFGTGEQKVFIIQGGQGAGKTIAIEMLLIDAMENAPCEMTVCSAELSKLKDTALNDYIKIRKDYDLFSERNYNRSNSTYTYGEGHFTEFIGLDKADVGKGRRRKVVFINEANKITLQQYTDITARAEIVILDYNPDAQFWVEELKNDFNFINLTFQDNEYLPDSELNNILSYFKRGYGLDYDYQSPDRYPEPVSQFWANKWRVYGLGDTGILEGAVFENWEQVDSLPEAAELIGCGVDFGFVNPAAVVAVYKMDGRIYLDEVFYETEKGNADMAEAMIKSQVHRKKSYADSAEPKSIREIKNLGVNLFPCESKTDIKDYAIQVLNKDTFYITKRSKNVVREFQGIVWEKDKRGVPTGRPVKKDDHSVDAVLYFIGSEGKYSGKYFIH